MKQNIKKLIVEFKSEAKRAVKNNQSELAWALLVKAHILSQPYAVLHTQVHWAMLKLAIKTLNVNEIIGQTFRLVLAAPGSLSKKYPKGNTGRSNVSAFKEMKVPEDLSFLDQ